ETPFRPEPLFAHAHVVAATDARGRRVHRVALTDAGATLRRELEIAARKAREEAIARTAENARRRLQQITAAASQLAETLDLAERVSRAASTAVVDLAHYCSVDLVDASGRVRRESFARADGKDEDLPFDPYAAHGSAAIVRSGRAEILVAPSMAELAGL